MLQELCEDKLCATLGPRSFGLLCSIAWELHRPHLLDRAFEFLMENASLMFLRQFLPNLAQLPVEVIASLELAARAQRPAEAQPDLEPDLEPSGKVASAALAALFVSPPETALGEGPVAEELALCFKPEPPSPFKEPQSSPMQLPEDKRRRHRDEVDKHVDLPSPSLVPSESPAQSPCMKQRPQPTAPTDWVEVLNRVSRRRKTSDVRSPELTAIQQPPKTCVPSKPPKAEPTSSDSHVLRLGDFMPAIRGRGSSGPSALLLAASQASQASQPSQLPSVCPASQAQCLDGPQGHQGPQAQRASPWASPVLETADLREILAVKPAPKAKQKMDRCSWGLEAMPSAQPKGKSLHEIERIEAQEREAQEILDFEAMFAALEVAEQAEAREREEGGKGGKAGKAGKAPRRGERTERERAERDDRDESGRHRGRGQGRGRADRGRGRGNRADRDTAWWGSWQGWSSTSTWTWSENTQDSATGSTERSDPPV